MNGGGRAIKTIEYNLCKSITEDGETGFGIQVVVHFKNFCEEETIESISVDENFVKMLIKFLYDYRIDVIHFKDIVSDYMLNSEEVC